MVECRATIDSVSDTTALQLNPWSLSSKRAALIIKILAGEIIINPARMALIAKSETADTGAGFPRHGRCE